MRLTACCQHIFLRSLVILTIILSLQHKFVRFYKTFPNILDSVSPKLNGLLSWTHYRILLQVSDDNARTWYAKEASEQTWSVRTLQRNISSQYYYRLLKSQHKDLVEKEILQKTVPLQDKLEYIKNPVVAEFLGFSQNTDYLESTLEKAIISNMEKFLLELGKGFAFVERQQHIHTEKEDYYIDLVFYNYMLRCFVLIDLKTTKVTHQDVGQMDMYVRMYDEPQFRNPTNSLRPFRSKPPRMRFLLFKLAFCHILTDMSA